MATKPNVPFAVSVETNAPFYIVFAGVNGAGKTTFYHSDLWRTANMPLHMARVNPDEIVREQKGAWQSEADNMKAGREALRRIEESFSRRRSFNQETTLTGHVALRNLARARELGYRVFMYYIGLDSPLTAIKRIEHRVTCGGHGIDEQVVMRRYRESLSNLARAIDYCEQVLVFDNTHGFACLGAWSRGVLAWWGGSSLNENWLASVITNDDIWQRV